MLIVSAPTVDVALVPFGSSHSPAVGLTSKPIVSAPTVGTSLGVAPAGADCGHAHWVVGDITELHVPGG